LEAQDTKAQRLPLLAFRIQDAPDLPSDERDRLAAGEPITYVSGQMGHKDSAITLRVYAHWLPDSTSRKGVDRLDEFRAVAHPLQCVVKGQSSQPVKVRPKEVSVHLGSYLGDGAGDCAIEAPGTQAHRPGGSASVRAATRVKPEQAPKGAMRAPSLLQ
jgi:hypothetical protein